MENKKCDCSQCVNWNECEIGLIVHNPLNDIDLIENYNYCNQNIPPKLRKFKIKKGDKVAQCTLKEHKGYLLGYESDVVRVSGFGSTGI